jgi:broad specificity phosphatase PhoE
MSRIRLFLLVMLGLFPAIAYGQSLGRSSPTLAEWLGQMRLGGYVIVLRHGATTSDVATDPMSNPAKKAAAGERQLSEAGRAQAKAVGEALRKLKIPVGLVLTSPLQRAVDTGTLLGLGEVTTKPELAEAGSAVSAEENKHRADALRQLVALRPPADNNLVIVTHKPNLIEAFGKDWVGIREGEASVFEPDGTATYKLVLRIRAEEWSALLQATQ